MKIKYYNLKTEKQMHDSHSIDAGQKLALLKEEDGLFLFETEDDTEIKRVFWAKPNEVDFLEELEKELTEQEQKEREIIISGNFLTLI
jgi:hypothetical protein